MQIYLNKKENLIDASNISISISANNICIITIIGHLLFSEEKLKMSEVIKCYLDSEVLFDIIPYKRQYVYGPEEKLILIGESLL